MIILILSACHRKSDDGFAAPPAAAPPRPAAIAGDDFETLVSATGVVLNGSKSWDPAGAAMTYTWLQTAGIVATLSDPTIASPTFTAPAAPETLTFSLTVTSTTGSDTDEVNVAVKSMIATVPAPEPWFVGYEKTGGITVTVFGGTPPFTYQWTGIEPWITITGSTTAATLGYTTPRLADFQNFPDRAEVAVLERTTQGRMQLRIKVTDSLGAVDEDFVNFSAGPFADTAANENVALGEPLFLNGALTAPLGAITAWTWTGTKPTGASITFMKPNVTALGTATDQRFVYFVPDQVGPYEVILTQVPGPVVKVINITCGKYVGAGNLTGATPDPFKGECASCHGGQLSWLADFANSWKETGHAHMFERILDPSSPYHAASQFKGHWNDAFNFGSNYSIDSRTVGWSRIPGGNSDGWAHRAIAEGYVFKDGTWPELVRKYPRTAGLSNVQCESCHGPGSEHAGDTTGIRKSFDSALCGRCHSRKQDLWEASSHGKPPITSPSGSGSCNGCHTAQGFVVEMRAQEGADPHGVLFAVSNLERPVIPFEDRRGTSCQACHDPHKKTAKMNAAGVDPQLRAFGRVTFRNGAVAEAGPAAVCYMCHQSRTDTTAGSDQMNARRAPHDSTAAEMLSGTNAIQFPGWSYFSSPHGIASRFVTPSKGENRQCLACHNDSQPGAGAVGYNALGGHTFNMKQGTGLVAAGDGTHPGAQTVAGSRLLTVASGPSLLKSVFPGDTLTISAGTDTGTFTVFSVDNARQLTLSAAGTFGGGAATTWGLTSVVKYNAAACTQCHTTASNFENNARADYDGSSATGSVQAEISGLRALLLTAINTKLVSLVGPGTTLAVSSRVRYNKLGSGTLRTFPGPSVTPGDNPDIVWSALSPAQQAEWLALYQAAYNYQFVGNDKSGGIHNTGYAVNLLQSAYKAVTGTPVGAPFVPFP